MKTNYAKWVAIVALPTVLAACADTPSGDFLDPYESVNRQVHAFNKSVDTAILRPVARGYGDTVSRPVRNGVRNVATNLSAPGDILNDLLQFNLEDAIHNSVRFVVNSTIGLGGLFDVAAASGAEVRASDFGETLHVWGFDEGAYVELPFFGPSTTRDTLGMVIDVIIDPVGHLLPPEVQQAAFAADIASRLDDRYSFQTTVDSVLYESADSYEQSRLLYLESRRFSLGATVDDDEDLYEGLFDDF